METIARVRYVLAEELGVDLGPALTGLRAKVLAMDPDLFGVALSAAARPLRSDEPHSAPVPAQLPPANKPFIGRRAEIARLTEYLTRRDGTTPVAVVFGLAGVGKTALVTEASHRVKSAFPDGQLYLNLLGPGRNPLRHPAP